MIPLDKKEVIDYVIKKLEEDVQTVQSSYERTRRESLDAPGAMQSQHDTSKKELSWLARGFAGRIEELTKSIDILRQLDIPPQDHYVQLCSVVELEDIVSGTRVNYVILPAGGGKTLDYEGTDITILGFRAPVSQSILGKKQGDQVKINLPQGNVTYRLVHVS